MSRKGQSITLSLQEHDKTVLQQIALELGSTWGDDRKPNISHLVKAIAQRKFLVTPNHDWSSARIQTLITAQQLLIDAGKIPEAQILTELLLSRSELTIPQRNELQHFVDNPPPPWRQTLDQHLRSHQPFRLVYYDASDRLWTFNVRHAHIQPIEKRLYLQCWCEESDGNLDLPELAHNRSLKLDRIPEAAITPLKAKWKPDLDRIEVEFHLFGGLVNAYRSQEKQDNLNELIAETTPVRRIVRSISSTFWFFREILPYGEDCEIIAPDPVRQRFRQKAIALARRYGS
ncbi:MAG: WYL domain-containing protein [Synechococcales bacterium]|nr:WYL domain-containing protein [Synechococcales bacterium]